ncbi:MAG: EFR1 family ferrodoxin [bacterium]
MANVEIFYFSGTGNTELLAEEYAAVLSVCGCAVGLNKIEKFTLSGAAPQVAGDVILGIGYPIHAFNAPKIVFDFIKLLPAGDGRSVFLFKCPGDSFVNGGSTAPVREALTKKGYRVQLEELLVMPGNIAAAHPPAYAQALYRIARDKIAASCADLLAGKERLQQNNLLEDIFTSLSRGEQKNAYRLGKYFYTHESCTGCGCCMKNCPTDNITIVGNRPVFGKKCIACFRCVYLCPSSSITLKNISKVIIPTGYNIRQALREPTGPLDQPAFDKRFKAYRDKMLGE